MLNQTKRISAARTDTAEAKADATVQVVQAAATISPIFWPSMLVLDTLKTRLLGDGIGHLFYCLDCVGDAKQVRWPKVLFFEHPYIGICIFA
jgi:hypothetical protein